MHADRDAVNAFSASKDVSGELVYVNYGRKEDFDLLASMGVPLAGKIAIAVGIRMLARLHDKH